MNKLHVRLALLVCGSVLLTLLMIMCAFNMIISRKMFRNADGALRCQLMAEKAPEGETYTYSPEIIVVFDADDYPDGSQQLYTPKERSVMSWCDGKSCGKTEKVQIDGNTYYIMCADAHGVTLRTDTITNADSGSAAYDQQWTFSISDGSDLDDGNFTSVFGSNIIMGNISELIGYVDITGELDMIRQINIVFIVTALIIGAVGSAMGYIIGRKLEQNQLAQKQFFENTSHELKTPLTSIRGYAEGIEKGIITDPVKTGRSIAAQTEKMSRLVEEILCIAKLESGSVKLSKESIDMPGFLQDCLMPFEGTVLSRKLDVSLDLEPMKVQGDPEKLEHAVTNLLTNALRYARTGIVVSCGGSSFRIQNDCEEIDDDTLEHLFERFYTGRDGNTGIGLALAKDIIGLHGWKITAERCDGGICFVVSC